MKRNYIIGAMVCSLMCWSSFGMLRCFGKKTASKKTEKTKLERLNSDLITAVNEGTLDEVKKLIALGAQVNTKGPFGWTPLRYAVANKDAKMVHYLIDKGASVDLVDQERMNLLQRCVITGFIHSNLSPKILATPQLKADCLATVKSLLQFDGSLKAKNPRLILSLLQTKLPPECPYQDYIGKTLKEVVVIAREFCGIPGGKEFLETLKTVLEKVENEAHKQIRIFESRLFSSLLKRPEKSDVSFLFDSL